MLAILEKYELEDASEKTGRNLFTIIVTAVALRADENKDVITIDLLDKLYIALGFKSRYELWNKYVGYLLEKIKIDPTSWIPETVERCIFETVLLESGE